MLSSFWVRHSTYWSLGNADNHIGVAVYKYRTRDRSTIRYPPSLNGKVSVTKSYNSEKPIDFDDISFYTEKPQRVVLSPRSFDDQVGWVPQITAYYADASNPVTPVSPRIKTKSRTIPLSVRTARGSGLRSPPPSYFDGDVQDNGLIPIPLSPALLTLPSSPFARLSPIVTPSPRAESFSSHDMAIIRQISRTSSIPGSARLPRLMTVTATFTPTLPDELSLKAGETVRLLEEYRDGWCLVQHIRQSDVSKGAAPRFCLQDSQGTVA